MIDCCTAKIMDLNRREEKVVAGSRGIELLQITCRPSNFESGPVEEKGANQPILQLVLVQNS